MIFEITVLDHYNVAPESSAVLGKRYPTTRNRVHILPEISVATSAAVPILPGMNSEL